MESRSVPGKGRAAFSIENDVGIVCEEKTRIFDKFITIRTQFNDRLRS